MCCHGMYLDYPSYPVTPIEPILHLQLVKFMSVIIIFPFSVTSSPVSPKRYTTVRTYLLYVLPRYVPWSSMISCHANRAYSPLVARHVHVGHHNFSVFSDVKPSFSKTLHYGADLPPVCVATVCILMFNIVCPRIVICGYFFSFGIVTFTQVTLSYVGVVVKDCI